MAVLKLNEANFSEVTGNGTVLVDFYADWCGPCKMMAPVVAEISEERGDITVGKVNVDECPALAQQFGVMSIPMLVVFKNGQAAESVVGFRPKKDILSLL